MRYSSPKHVRKSSLTTVSSCLAPMRYANLGVSIFGGGCPGRGPSRVGATTRPRPTMSCAHTVIGGCLGRVGVSCSRPAVHGGLATHRVRVPPGQPELPGGHRLRPGWRRRCQPVCRWMPGSGSCGGDHTTKTNYVVCAQCHRWVFGLVAVVWAFRVHDLQCTG